MLLDTRACGDCRSRALDGSHRQIKAVSCDDAGMRVDWETEVRREHLSLLFDREADRIFGYLLVRSGSRAVAEDLTGEVFVEAARRCAEGRHCEVTGPWLQTVARRRLVDHWRRSSSRRRLDARLRHGALLEPEREVDLADDRPVLEALDSLPDRQRAALCLRYLDGFSVAEVADALEVQYQAAESLLARGRRSFARAYEELL